MSPTSRPRIAIAGLAIESSTFSPATTLAAAFHPRRGQAVVDSYSWLAAGTPLGECADWVPILVGSALPGGIVTRAAWDELTGEILEGLRTAGAVDGLYYDIHGAMSVEGIDDPEAVLLADIRAIIGTNALVSTSMDLHGNVSRELVHNTDLITCYRLAPHEDTEETRERAVQNLVDRLDSGLGRPIKAWIPVPILLPGEKTSTRLEPAKSIYAAVAEVEATEGVLDAAIWVGYAWADEPRNRAAVVVTGDDAAAVTAGAEKLARGFWAGRDDFEFVAPTATLDESVDRALASTARPYFISDSGDNPTAGGAGDVTWGVTQLLARPEFQGTDYTVIYASVPGEAAVAAAVEAGVGGTVSVEAGALVDDRHSGPVRLDGIVRAIKHGDKHAETEVVIQVGSVHVIVTKLRKPYHLERDFTELGLDPRSADVVVVKIGYLEPELFDMSADWTLALTPGGVDQALERLGHRRIRRPMFPFDSFTAEPNLSARLIPTLADKLGGTDE
jgi:microcystin degradation protein MlrC